MVGSVWDERRKGHPGDPQLLSPASLLRAHLLQTGLGAAQTPQLTQFVAVSENREKNNKKKGTDEMMVNAKPGFLTHHLGIRLHG